MYGRRQNPDNNLSAQKIENKVETINEEEKPLAKNINLNNYLNDKLLKIDLNKDISKYDSSNLKNEKIGYNKLKNGEPKQINENLKMDRKIIKPEECLQTPKIDNKIEEIKEKQEMEYIMKRSFNQSELEKHMNEIEEFRDTFILNDIYYSNEKILDTLKKHNFDFHASFSSFFD